MRARVGLRAIHLTYLCAIVPRANFLLFHHPLPQPFLSLHTPLRTSSTSSHTTHTAVMVHQNGTNGVAAQGETFLYVPSYNHPVMPCACLHM